MRLRVGLVSQGEKRMAESILVAVKWLRRCVVLGVAVVFLTGCAALGMSTNNASSATPSEDAVTEPTPTQTFKPFSTIVDSGPREGANGEALQDAEGNWYYRVVSGDVGGIICDRFGRSWWQLETIDRQNGFDCHTMIYVGQIVIPTTYSQELIERTGGLPPTPDDNPFDTESPCVSECEKKE